jgi:hypothetical protein
VNALIKNELSDKTLDSQESRLGSVELDIVQYFREVGSSEKAKLNIVAD